MRRLAWLGLQSLSHDQRLVFLAVLLAGFAEGLWLHLLSIYIGALGARPAQIGATLGLASLGIVFIYLPSGLLADRGRHKHVIVAAWLTSVAAMLGLAVAPDWRWAGAAMALYYLSSFGRPALSGYVAHTDRGGNLSRSFALVFSGYSIGSLLSPALGGWIGEHVSLRAVFVAATAVYLLSTLAMAQLTNVPAPSVARSLPFRRLWSDRTFLWQIGVFFALFFALDVGVVLAPNYLQDVKHLRVEQIGGLGTVASLGTLCLTLALGQIHAERRRSLFIAQCVSMAALGLLIAGPAAGASGSVPRLLYLAYFLRGGATVAWPIISARLSHWLDADVLSLGYGFRDSVMRLALTLSPLAAGQLYARGPVLPLYAGLAALAVTLVLTLTLPRRSRARRLWPVDRTEANAATQPPSA